LTILVGVIALVVWLAGATNEAAYGPLTWTSAFVMANSTRNAHSCPKKITEDVHQYAAEQGNAEEEALKKGMEAKSKEFVEKGAEVYAKV
jgi:NAD-dependent oxidoreductase involved in siderophore biosynthesis